MYYITGYMGAGKSTLGAALAQSLDIPLLDTDCILEERFGIPVAMQLLQDPIGFRKSEAELIAQLTGVSTVVMGGGAIENEETRTFLKGKPVIFLDPGVDICWQRVQGDAKQRRPLATDYDSFVALYEKRLPLYLSVCSWHVTDSLPPEQLANKLVKAIKQL